MIVRKNVYERKTRVFQMDRERQGDAGFFTVSGAWECILNYHAEQHAVHTGIFNNCLVIYPNES